MIWAEFWDFVILTSITQNARWAGAPSQKEMARRYYTQELCDAVRELPQGEEGLAKILCEIMEDIMEDLESGDQEDEAEAPSELWTQSSTGQR
jgi:hypothetical protein